MTGKLVLKGDSCSSWFTPSMALALTTRNNRLETSCLNLLSSSITRHAGGLSQQQQG